MAVSGLTEGKTGFGVKFQINTTGTTYVDVAELTRIGGITITRDTEDFTNHQSVDQYEELRATIKRTGTVELEGNFILGNTSQENLRDLIDSEVITKFHYVFPTTPAKTWEITGQLLSFSSGDFEVGSKMQFSASVKIIGKPNFAYTTP